jgi:hypothetical protein
MSTAVSVPQDFVTPDDGHKKKESKETQWL